jgi:hypothetical protein
MTRKERLEDLGIIFEKLSKILDQSLIFDECVSKHTRDNFIEKYSKPKSLEELHDQMRWLKDELWDIYYLAAGNEA